MIVKYLILLATLCSPIVPVTAQDSIPSITTAPIPQDRVDTIYYNKNWKVSHNKAFASYYRLALYPADSTAERQFNTYYKTGELQGEGSFIKLDKTDDSRSVFVGNVTTYYKTGGKETQASYINGKLNGEYTKFYNDGKVSEHCIMKDGNRDGLFVSFTEDGRVCKVIPYSKGKDEGYYVITDADGNYSKYSIADDKPALENPTLDEIKTEYRNGVAWPYYNKNGLIVGISNSMTDYIGDYREIGVFIVNKSMSNVDIDPAQIEVYSKKGNKHKDYKLVTADEYDDKIMKIKKKNAKRTIKNKVVVEKERENNMNSNLGAQVFSAGTSNTIKAFQQRMCSMKVLDDDNHMRYAERMPEDLGYLERTTVHPGEIVYGYLYTSDRKSKDLFVNVKISGVDYLFEWKQQK